MYFKVLDENGNSCNGGLYVWDLPYDGKPGEWTTKIEGKLRVCFNGYHLAPNEKLFDWIGKKSRVFIAEKKFKACSDLSISQKREADKICVRQARLVKEILISKDDAERVIDYVIDAMDSRLSNGHCIEDQKSYLIDILRYYRRNVPKKENYVVYLYEIFFSTKRAFKYGSINLYKKFFYEVMMNFAQISYNLPDATYLHDVILNEYARLMFGSL